MKNWDQIKKTVADTAKVGVLAAGLAGASVPGAEAQTMTGTATERMKTWRFGNFVDLGPITKGEDYRKLYPGRGLPSGPINAHILAYFQKMFQERVTRFANPETNFNKEVDAVTAKGGTFRLNMSDALYPELFKPFGAATHQGFTVVDMIIQKDKDGKVVGKASLQDPRYPGIDHYVGFELN